MSSTQYIHQMLVSKELGGAGLIALHVASFLRETVRESHVWIPGTGPAEEKCKELGLVSHRYDASEVFSSSRIKATIRNWKLGRALFPYRNGVIHIHSPFYYSAFCKGMKTFNLKTVVHIHLQEEENSLRQALRLPPDVIITCAQFLVDNVRRALPERCQETQRIVSIPNAVDIERFRPGEKTAAKYRVGIPPDTPMVLMVANLAPHKGQETAMRAAAVLKTEGIPTLFWFAGTERGGKQEHTNYLRRLSRELEVADRVNFLGQRDDIADLLRAADVFLLPSSSEGLPLSVLEAQATRVPVLAAPTAGIPEIVLDGQTGFLIPPGDVKGYASRIKSILSDCSISQYVAERAYANVLAKYQWKTYCENLRVFYQNLIETNPSCSQQVA
jgi:glycosyltransferase involved in cell wall biosynthesis